MKTGRILLADDDESVLSGLAELLRAEGHDVVAVPDGAAAIAAVRGGSFDVVLTDLQMPGADGVEVLERTLEIAPQTLVLLFTGHASVETAVTALRKGAHDYIVKPVHSEDVLAKVRRLLAYRSAAWESQVLRRELASRLDVERMVVGDSPPMNEVFGLLRKVAPTTSTVLLTGESGVGKDVFARALHRFSNRADAVFLPINSSAIPESLLESQLFGHTRGAFTGAVSAEEGLFQRARGGTIFLDEIGDLPIGLQAKLLRAIEQKEVLPVGATQPIRVDVRIIAATNRELRKAVGEGRFREDLYYRLNVVHLEIPPLRERREDVPKLVELFVQRHNAELNRRVKGVDNATMKLLVARPWKGNVRELDNVIEHAMIVAEGDWITPADLPRLAPDEQAAALPVGDDLTDAVRAYEKAHIARVLRKTGDDKRRAAELLGVSLSKLYRRIEELEISSAPE